jgi:myo-inositol-1(or 4)-monophosphatase
MFFNKTFLSPKDYMDIEFSRELTIAKKAVLEAGNFLRKNKDNLNKVTSSTDRDIKLQADIEAEKIIKDIIKNDSSFGILAEESGMSSEESYKNLWVVDPLDGTANYSRNIPLCCVSIALLSDTKPVLGVIYDFNNDELYEGSINTSARLNGQAISVSKTKKSQEGILVTGLPNDTDYSDEAIMEMIKNFQNWRKVRMIGSAAIASAYIASGKADLYMENKSYLWDVAAGAAIVNAAGGQALILNQNEKFQVNVRFSNSLVQA